MDAEALKALMRQTKQSLKKTEKTTKVNAGKNRVRLLHGWRPAEQHVWFHNYGQHFIKDAADQIQAVYMCNAATHGTHCEVCAAIAAAARVVTDDVTAELLVKAKASRTVLLNALMLDSSEPNTPQVLELKMSAFEACVDIVEAWGAKVLDPDEGSEIQINRDGKGLNTKYTAGILPAVYKVPAASLAKLHNLDEYVKQESDEQMRRAIAAVNLIAGILPAGSGRDVPTSLPPPDFDDVLSEPVAPATAALAPTDVALDSELDSLMSDL